MLHKNTRGEEVPPVVTVPSRIGEGRGSRHEEAERFLASRTPLGMTATSRGKRKAARCIVPLVFGYPEA
jgi:hypothetical protein